MTRDPSSAPRTFGGWTCPDCGALNEASDAACECGHAEDEPTELDLVYGDLAKSQAEARRYRDALLELFCVVKALSCPGGVSTETLREYVKTHPAARKAADALRTDRLDEPRF